jgi:DNA-3-methyladenine glycosylase II
VPRVVRRAVIDGCDALARQEPRFAPIIATLGPADPRGGRPRRSHFAELVRAICYQQLAGAAARTIHGRLEAALADDVTPERVLALSIDTMRAAGLSANKSASIRDLAEKVVAGDVELDRVSKLSDDEIVGELVLVRGIGRWTAEMFLIFQLGRLDVWPVDDLGVRKGYGFLFAMPTPPTAKQLQPLGDQLRPYRSLAAWYCWRAADTVTPGDA